MAIPKIATQGTETLQHRRRVAESINDILDFSSDDSRRRTKAEALAGVSPLNPAYPPGDIRRMSPDDTGAIDVTDKIQTMLDVAGITEGGDVKEVVVPPGTYKVRRLYIRYSNVWLRLMPGAVIQQTRDGIVDTNTAGQPPSYAVIHINPLDYVASPVSPITAIENVRVYGGGTVKGPYATDGAYDGFSLGIVSNDCHDCAVHGIKVMNCRAENILHNPSGWNTVRGVKILSCDISGGGEVGINNARDFAILDNDVHDSWMQNGVGGNGDGGIVCLNRIRGMARGGMTIGGSGARDIDECRNVIYGFNTIVNTNVDDAGAHAVFMSDDGATTVPKNGLKFIGNVIDICTGNLMMAADYASGFVEITDNTFRSLDGTDPTLFAVIDGSATYLLRGNSYLQGAGNAARCLDVSGGTPTIILEDGQYYDPTITTDIQGPGDFTIRHEYHSSFTATLTGATTAPTVTMYYSKKGHQVTLYLAGITATSNSSTMGISGLPAWITPARNQNFALPVTDNGANVAGIIQVRTDNTLRLFRDIDANAMTGSGTSGIPGPYVMSYVLN